MLDFITTPLTTAIVFYFIYRILELFVRRNERITFLSKMKEFQPTGNDLPRFEIPWPQFRIPSPHKSNLLRVACLFLGLGIGMLAGHMLSMMLVPGYARGDWGWEVTQMTSIIYGSVLFICGGTSLLIAYVVENRCTRKHTTDDRPASTNDTTEQSAL